MDNLERRARAICANDLAAAQAALFLRAAHIERYWPVVAAEITGGIVDGEGRLPVPELQKRIEEYRVLIKARPGAG